jgi:cold shock CspA family protein
VPEFLSSSEKRLEMPVGRIKFYRQDRGFGIIRSDSADIFFHFTALAPDSPCELDPKTNRLRYLMQVGEHVAFEMAETRDGRPCAVEVRGIEEPQRSFEGYVESFDVARGFGFLRTDARPDRIFVHHQDIATDSIGRRCLAPGMPVSFDIHLVPSRDDMTRMRERATYVQNNDPSAHVDISTYTEYGTVVHWNGDTGHVLRPSRERLLFNVANIVSMGVETIAIGTFLNYGLEHLCVFNDKIHDFRDSWFAKDISVCLPASDEIVPEESAYASGSIEDQFL